MTSNPKSLKTNPLTIGPFCAERFISQGLTISHPSQGSHVISLRVACRILLVFYSLSFPFLGFRTEKVKIENVLVRFFICICMYVLYLSILRKLQSVWSTLHVTRAFIQRGNVASLLGTLPVDSDQEE